LEHVGVFSYSREEGSPAAALPGQIPEEVKEERRRLAMELQRVISREKNAELVGEAVDVLVDRPGVGRTACQAPEVDGVSRIRGRSPHPGEMVRTRVVAASDYDLAVEVV
jgi:ribosomal protein S12 methylthiotransferase